MHEKFGTSGKLKALEGSMREYVNRPNWERYRVVAGHGAWEGDGGVHVRVPAESLTEQARGERVLDNILREMKEHPNITVPGDLSIEVAAHPLTGGGPATVDFFASGDDAPAEMLAKLELAKDHLAESVSGLDPEEYNAVRIMRVGDMLKKGYWQLTDETRWPAGTRQTHVDIMRRLKLRDRIREAFEALPAEQHNDIKGLEVHDFIKEFVLKGRSSI